MKGMSYLKSIAICSDDEEFIEKCIKIIYQLKYQDIKTVIYNNFNIFMSSFTQNEYHDIIIITWNKLYFQKIFQIDDLMGKYNNIIKDIIVIVCGEITESYFDNFSLKPYAVVKQNSAELEQIIADAIKNMNINREKALCFNNIKDSYSLDVTKITYIEKDKNYIIIHLLNNKSIRHRVTLIEIYKALLFSDGFEYASKSSLVNLKNIVHLSKYELVFCNSEKTYISRRYYANLKEAFDNYNQKNNVTV